MTHAEVETLFSYDAWAMERIFHVVSSLPPEQYSQHLGSSHGGIHGTLVHAVAADRFWLDRLTGKAEPVMMSEKDFPTFSAVRDEWSAWRSEMERYLQTLSDSKLEEMFSHKDSKGNTHSYPVSHVLQHLVNHSTYHRGQVVSMLRQQGVKPVNSDLIYYYRTLQRK